MAKSPLELANQLIEEKKDYVPFKLDKKIYPDVEETPYGFIYNVNGRSITDAKEQARAFDGDRFKPDGEYGFTLEVDGDEVYYPSFDEAYKAAKGGK